MIIRLDQKTTKAKWEMYEFQKNALHEYIVIVFYFDVPSLSSSYVLNLTAIKVKILNLLEIHFSSYFVVHFSIDTPNLKPKIGFIMKLLHKMECVVN